MQGNDNDDGEPPGVSEDCLGHAQENGALSFSIAKSDQSLIRDTNNPTALSQSDFHFKNSGFTGNLLSADTIIESGWYSDQWWKWDCASMMGVANVGCSGPQWLPQVNFSMVDPFNNPWNWANKRPYLRNGDPDEPDMPQAHVGMCPAPFSEDYQGPGTSASVTARTWYTRAAGRSVVVSGQGNAFIEVQPRNGEGPYSTGQQGIDFFGDGQFYCIPFQSQGSPHLGQTDGAAQAAPYNKHSGAQRSILPWYCQVMTAQMECEQRGEGDTMETKYTFVVHFGQMHEYDGARTCNNCWPGDGEQTVIPPNSGGPEIVPNQCGFPVCGLISSARWCPCTGGSGIPYDGFPRVGPETGCNSMYDGTCGRFCRCKQIRMKFQDGDHYYECDERDGRNTYDGCDLSSCGAGCFVDCLGTPVGQCNCPPFSPDNYWKNEKWSGPNADPYDPPLHLCSSLCGTTPPLNAGSWTSGDLCRRNGCTAPEANFPVTQLATVAIQYPYSSLNSWLPGNLSPQEYFDQLTDEQNSGKLYGTRSETGIHDKYNSRLEIT